MELQYYIDGYSYEEIAKMTNQPLGLVKSLIMSQRKKIETNEN